MITYSAKETWQQKKQWDGGDRKVGLGGGGGGGGKLWSAITPPPIALIPSLQETYTFLYSNASVFWLSCELKLYCLFDRWLESIF